VNETGDDERERADGYEDGPVAHDRRFHSRGKRVRKSWESHEDSMKMARVRA
jgi:hypothetical protein